MTTGRRDLIKALAGLPVLGLMGYEVLRKVKYNEAHDISSKKYKYIRNFNSLEVLEQNFGDNDFVNAFIRMGAMKLSDQYPTLLKIP